MTEFEHPRAARRMITFALAALATMSAMLPARTTAAARELAAAQPTSVSSLPHPPAGVPRDYVVTPNGFFHPSCVHELAAGEVLHPGGRVVARDGSERRVGACAFAHYAPDGTRLARDALPSRLPALTRRAPNAPQEINGWIAYASYVLPRAEAALYIRGYMSVPDAPPVNAGQVVYFFPGLEDIESVQTILQPVLGWNAFDDSVWTIASWNCCMSGEVWHSPPVGVEPGTTIDGRVTGSNCDGASCTDWSVLSRDAVTDQATTLETSDFGQIFDWVFGAVLEAYGVSQCGHLPATGSEEFSDTHVHSLRPPTAGGLAQQEPWEPTILPVAPNCSYVVTPHPDVDSREITIEY